MEGSPPPTRERVGRYQPINQPPPPTPTTPRQVCFAKPKVAEETLSDWAADISELLTLLERTTHLINKEQMVHKVNAAAAGASTTTA